MLEGIKISWNGKEDLQGRKHLRQLEAHLGGGLAFNSSQAAITACLEILGSRFQPISVIMPVNCSMDALNGVIRANARPVVTDIDEHTMQANVEQVQEALEGTPEAVVYLNRPGGLPVAQELLEAVQDVPTICDTRVLPTEQKMLFTFNIYDISVAVGEGAVLYTKNDDQVKDLIQIRADAKTELAEVPAALAYKRQPQFPTYPDGSRYSEVLDNTSKSGIIGYNSSTPRAQYLIQVKNAKLLVDYFSLGGVQRLQYGCIPVYKYPIMRKRWKQEPNYPVAEKLFNQLVLLPNHEDIAHKELLEKLWELIK